MKHSGAQLWFGWIRMRFSILHICQQKTDLEYLGLLTKPYLPYGFSLEMEPSRRVIDGSALCSFYCHNNGSAGLRAHRPPRVITLVLFMVVLASICFSSAIVRHFTAISFYHKSRAEWQGWCTSPLLHRFDSIKRHLRGLGEHRR